MRGSGSAPRRDPVRLAAREESVRIDLVGPAEKVRGWLVGSRAEDGKPRRSAALLPGPLRTLEIRKPLLERRAFRVTLAHRCETLVAGR